MRKREGKKERERGQKKREKEKEGEEKDPRTDASDGHLVQAVLTGMGLRRSRTSAHAPNRVTYWEAPASNIGACAETPVTYWEAPASNIGACAEPL